MLDTPPEEAFDRFTRLAARWVGAPMAFVSVIDDHRVYFKSTLGFPAGWESRREVPLSESLSQYIVAAGEPLRLGDLHGHPLGQDHPAAAALGMAACLGVPLMAPDGQVFGAFCVVDTQPHEWTDRDVAFVQDIAAAVVSEFAFRSELRESHVKFSTMVEAAPLAIVTLRMDEHYTVKSWNPGAERLFGFTPAEVLGKPYPLVPADRGLEFDRLNQMLRREGKVYGVQSRRQRRDGTQIDVFLLGTELPPGADDERQAVFFFVDITEQKQAESEVRRANAALQSLIDLAPQAIVAVDLSWNVTRWNNAARELFGWTSEEVLGKPLPYLPPERAHEFHARQKPDDDVHQRALETQRRCKDGSLVEVLMSTGVLRDAAGAATGYIAILSDLTDHKMLEGQLRQAQKMEAVGQLAGGIAHDFNNLLTVIKAQTQFALEAIPAGDPAREDLASVSAAASRAAALTRQLLAFSRKQLLKPRVLALNSSVMSVLPMLARLIGEDIEIVTRLSPEPGRVLADPAQLEQVLVNLALNARDAMPHGGVLSVQTELVQLDDSYVDQHEAAIVPGDYVMLAVGDTGAGIEPEVRLHIFEPFFTTKEQGQGTGLGLSTVYGIVKQSGGYIWVYSEPGCGTWFRIYLPVTREEASDTTAVEVPAQGRRGSETVLLVEDEEALRRIVKRILERQGYTVIPAANGPEALERARTHGAQIDLLLTDVILPEMSGPVLAEKFAGEWPGTRVLFMSGYTDDEVIRRGLLKPGVDLLEKPFTSDEIAGTVRSVLDRVAGVGVVM